MANHKPAAKSHPWKRSIAPWDIDPLQGHSVKQWTDYLNRVDSIAEEKRAARQREIEARGK